MEYQKPLSDCYEYGTRVEILKTVWIKDPSQWQFIIKHNGPLVSRPPWAIKEGTIGVVGERIPGVPINADSYTVMVSIQTRSDEVACVRVLLDKNDIRIPKAKIIQLPRGVANGEK